MLLAGRCTHAAAAMCEANSEGHFKDFFPTSIFYVFWLFRLIVYQFHLPDDCLIGNCNIAKSSVDLTTNKYLLLLSILTTDLASWRHFSSRHYRVRGTVAAAVEVLFMLVVQAAASS